MRKIRALFETQRFYADLEKVRQKRNVSWIQLTIETGLPPSVASNRSDNPRIDILVPLAIWADLTLTDYILVFNQAGQQKKAPRPKAPPRVRQTNSSPGYDVSRFYADLDQIREARGVSWGKVWRRTSTVAPLSLPVFIYEGIPMNERACKALAAWAGLDFSLYTQGAHDVE